ncbi:MAG: DUF1636 family protein [Reyranella sp.]
MTATLFICVSCQREGQQRESQENDALDRPGRILVQALEAHQREHGPMSFAVAGVDCLAVCKRPCTVAFCGTGKWTYLIGDIDPAAHMGDVISAALSYAISETGIVPWRERPLFFRKGVIARVPPMSHRELQ